MESALAAHVSFGEQSGVLLGSSPVLKAAARQLAAALPDGDVVLLARTDAALAVGAAAAVLRAGSTSLMRAFIGREGWDVPERAFLVEPIALTPGLEETLRQSFPGVEVLAFGVAGKLRAAA